MEDQPFDSWSEEDEMSLDEEIQQVVAYDQERTKLLAEPDARTSDAHMLAELDELDAEEGQ